MNKECCTHDCHQGRDCPRCNRPFDREDVVVMIACVAAAIALVVLVFGGWI